MSNILRPNSFEEIVGQHRIKRILSTITISAQKRGETLPSICLSGKSGYGKTSFGIAIGNELNTHTHIVNASSIRNSDTLIDFLSQIQENDVCIIDEIHALRKRSQENLYHVIEDSCYYTDNGVKVEIPKFNIIGATTDLGGLYPPLRNRFGHILEFDQYSEDELIEICFFACKKLGFNLTKETALTISKTCRGTPRFVTNRVKWLYDYMIANNIKNASTNDIIEIIKIQGYDENGFSEKDIQYMKRLGLKTISLPQISIMVGLDQVTVKNDLEPFLIEKGFLQIQKSGRSLTPEGLNYIYGKEEAII